MSTVYKDEPELDHRILRQYSEENKNEDFKLLEGVVLSPELTILTATEAQKELLLHLYNRSRETE